MKRFTKGIIIALVHVCIVSALGVKLLYDRATLPRVWVNAVPYDPSLPVRGRYVSMQLIVEPRGLREPKPGQKWELPQPAVLSVEEGRLVATAKPQYGGRYDPSDLHVRYINIDNNKVPVLEEPVTYFIPEHIPDPSRRPQNEQLWVEATIPKKGIPRPIRLGISKDNGPVTPLEID